MGNFLLSLRNSPKSMVKKTLHLILNLAIVVIPPDHLLIS
jgi:hypothetical protein